MATSAAPTPGTGLSSPGNAYQALFNQSYYESKNPVFWGFYAGRPDSAGNARWSALPPLTQTQVWALFAQLLAQGYGPLDEEIEGEGFDPYMCMWMRSVRYGQTWEPAGTGNVQVVNINSPGAVVTPGEFTGPVPPGQIAVSILYPYAPAYVAPEVTTPVPPPIAPLASPVGVLRVPSATNPTTQVGGMFAQNVNSQGVDGYAVGNYWPAEGVGVAQGLTGQWQKQLVFMGMATYWVKTA